MKQYITKKNALLTGVIFVISLGMIVFKSSTRSVVQNSRQNKTLQPTQKLISPTVRQNKIATPIVQNTISYRYATQSPTTIPEVRTTVTSTVAASTPTALPTVPPATSTPLPPTDTEPPHSNIIYPSQNGEITYKTDGKVCATMSAPSDNVSNHNDIQTAFRFDGDGWSSFEKGRSYLCKDVLSNGAHSLSVQSKDLAGNTESEQVISFVVNIPGN